VNGLKLESVENSQREDQTMELLYMKIFKPIKDSKIFNILFINSLYVHGGRDLREGAIDNMWRLDLDAVMRATEDANYPC
jgi:hypothetical protein